MTALDYGAIEKSLAELWRSEKEGENAVTRAALWNVVAHTTNAEDHSTASQTLARASEAVPQRAIVIRADVHGPAEISSWISANCHRIGGEKQVCSEEVAIVAGGEKIRNIPPLVNALLIPDMPVAFWWLGDLPNSDRAHAYVETILDVADRLIVDSSAFDIVGDLMWLDDIARRTFTAPADLNWVKLEDWRLVTAKMFDAPSMRDRMRTIRHVSVTASGGTKSLFGDSIESLYFAAWLSVQTGVEDIDCDFCILEGDDRGALNQVKIKFDDGGEVSIERDRERNVVIGCVDGVVQKNECVARVVGRRAADLVVRQLKRPEADNVFSRVLPVAIQLAAQVTR